MLGRIGFILTLRGALLLGFMEQRLLEGGVRVLEAGMQNRLYYAMIGCRGQHGGCMQRSYLGQTWWRVVEGDLFVKLLQGVTTPVTHTQLKQRTRLCCWCSTSSSLAKARPDRGSSKALCSAITHAPK